MLHVPRDADDFSHPSQRSHPDPAPRRTSIAKELARERLTDDDTRGGGSIVTPLEAAAIDDRNLHHVEITGTGDTEDRFAIGLPLVRADKTPT